MSGTFNLHEQLVEEVRDFVDQLAEAEGKLGASTIIKRYGKDFRPKLTRPDWLRLGEARNCFNNATALAATRDDVFYTEGYATEPELVLPVHHAWLVDHEGKVIDPTWKDTRDHAYFGISFRRNFVRQVLDDNSGQAGILVNLHLLRSRHRDPKELEQILRSGMRDL